MFKDDSKGPFAVVKLRLVCILFFELIFSAVSWLISLGSRIWKSEKKDGSFGECEFSVRLDKESPSERDSSVPDLNSGFLRILASNLYLQLQMNSISGLVEFFEDEMVSKPMPSKVILDNLQVQLQVCYFTVRICYIMKWYFYGFLSF